jgi:hypothetical protein
MGLVNNHSLEQANSYSPAKPLQRLEALYSAYVAAKHCYAPYLVHKDGGPLRGWV